jgi:hypothetical protein
MRDAGTEKKVSSPSTGEGKVRVMRIDNAECRWKNDELESEVASHHPLPRWERVG